MPTPIKPSLTTGSGAAKIFAEGNIKPAVARPVFLTNDLRFIAYFYMKFDAAKIPNKPT
jgi:hypothetical protein